MDTLAAAGAAGLPGLAARATVVLAAALLLSGALRRAAAGARHALWTTTFALLLLLPMAVAWLPGWELPILPGPRSSAATGTSGSAEPDAASVPTDPIRGRPPVAGQATGRARSDGDGRGGSSGATSPVPPPGAVSRPAEGGASVPLALLLWALGSAAAMGSVTVGTLRFRALVAGAEPVRDPVWLRQLARLRLRLGIDRDVRVLRTAGVSTPMTGGWRRPVVLLPEASTTWTPERREVVLLHELVHVRRHDALRQLLGQAALSLYWFHPLGWLAARRAAVSREQACDEAVLALGTRPSEYAGHLLALAEGLHAAPALASLPMIQPSQLERRIMSILSPRPPRASAPVTAIALSLVGGLGVSAATARPVGGARAEADVLPPRAAIAPGGVSQRVGPPDVAVGRPPVGPRAAGVARAGLQEAPTCAAEGWSGNFSGTITTGERRTERSGWLNGDRVIQRYLDDIRLCMRIHGDVVMTDDGLEVRAVGRDSWVVLESEGDGVQRLVITEDASGIRDAWSVDGREAEFDADARAWRDHMFAVLGAYWEASRLRGQESSLRGRISSYRGHVSSLRGRMSSHRGHISSLRGRISSYRGHVSSLNGRISSLRGHVSSLNGQISSLRGRISSLRSARRATDDAGTRGRLDDEIAGIEARIGEVEAEIADYDLDGRVAGVEAEIADYDLDGRVAEVEAEIADYDLDGKLRALEREIEDYDLDGKVREVEREIEELDADRRAREIEGGVEADAAELRRLIDRL